MDTQTHIEKKKMDLLWPSILKDLEVEIPSTNFKTWFENSYISKMDDSEIVVGVANEFVRTWIKQKYQPTLVKVIKNHIEDVKTVKIVVSRINRVKGSPVVSNRDVPQSNKMPFQEYTLDNETKLNTRYTFENFIITPSNELAHTAAAAITDKLGIRYNPFFIYGQPGVGKTHLIQAIGNKIANTYDNLKVYYLTSEEFVLKYQKSVQTGMASSFKDIYRSYDVLIIDDCQFFDETKVKSMEELLHLFNSLYDNNKQIVLSADRKPEDIQGLEERLKSRFASGMLLDLPLPDSESREIMIKSKAKENGLILDDEMIKFISSNLDKKGVREIEGTITTLKLKQDTYKENVSIQDVKKILRTNFKSQVVGYNDVIKHTCSIFEVDQNLILNSSRKREIVMARQVIMYLLRESLDLSFSSIGSKLGGKDHTTVIHSCEKIKKVIEKDMLLNEKVESVKKALGV